MGDWGVKFSLPDKLAEKVSTFGETSYGATVVTLVLKNGSRIPSVSVAGPSDVVKAKNAEDHARLATLTGSDILDVLPEP